MDSFVIAAALAVGVTIFLLVSADWHNGMFFILAVGFLQDLVRKLIPGEPVALTAAVGVTMLVVWRIGLTKFGGHVEELSVRRHYPAITKALSVFGLLVFFQSFVTIVNYGSISIAAIGLVAYLAPIPAIWIGWWYCRTEKDFLRLLLVYTAFGIAVALGVYLSWFGLDWVSLKQVGEALVFYTFAGIVGTHSGFMRAAEIAGWHLGAAACFVIVLATTKQSLIRTVMASLALAVLVSALVLTGRRKALAMIGLFIGIFAIMLQFSRNRDARTVAIGLVGLTVATVSTLFFVLDDGSDGSDASAFSTYSERSGSLYGDAWDRFYNLGIASVVWAINEVGVFGLGAGVSSQGAQHFGIELNIGSAEGGLGKIIVELGLPGLMVLAWVMFVFSGIVRRLIAQANQSNERASTIPLALVAFLLANVPLFITASQIFGDPFVLILLGIVFGAVLATPRLLKSPPSVDTRVLQSRGGSALSSEARLRRLRF